MKTHIDYLLVRQKRRTISIQIDPNGTIRVKAPYLVPKFFIDTFVQNKHTWITKHRKHTINSHIHNPKIIKEGNIFLYLGNKIPLKINNQKEISITDSINIPSFLMFRVKQELIQWFIKQAKTIITNRVVFYSEILHKPYTSISFSDTKSKWGSCSHDNKLQFSWRLIMTPLLVIDYVVIHELIHTKIKNHSSTFWNEVAKHKPAYKQHRKWLRDNSALIHSYLKNGK